MATQFVSHCDQCGATLDVDGRKKIHVAVGQLAGGNATPVKIQSAELTEQAQLDFCSPGCLRTFLAQKVSP